MAVITKTLRSSGGDYSLMSTWESTEQTDLVTAGDSHVLECYNDWPSGLTDPQISITGWTTDATNFITIKAAAGSEHNGVVGAGFRIHNTNNAYGVTASQGYTVIQDIEITSNYSCLSCASTCSIDRLIVRILVARNSIYGMVGSATFNNCLVIAPADPSFDVRCWSAANGTIRNCTVIGGRYGLIVFTGNTATITNTVAYGSTNTAFYTGFGSGSFTGDYNASGDTSSPGAHSVDNITSTAFVDYAGGNYRPSDTGVLAGVGSDLSGTFTDDVRGETRTEWSIGAFDSSWILRTLRSSGGDYSLMSVWESTEQTDLTASGDRHILECYNDWPSGLNDSCSVSGWTTSNGGSNHVTIRAAPGHEHNGVVGAGFWMYSGVNGIVLSAGQTDTIVEDIEVVNTGALSGSVALGSNGASTEFRRLICRLSDPSAIGIALRFQNTSSSSSVYCAVENCLAINAGTGGNAIWADARYHTYVNNCTGVGGAVPIYQGFDGSAYNRCYFKNCVGVGGSISAWASGGSFDSNSDYNAGDDATAPGANSVDNITTAAFVNYAGGDYTPAAGGALAGAGTDLSAFFTDDITGATR